MLALESGVHVDYNDPITGALDEERIGKHIRTGNYCASTSSTFDRGILEEEGNIIF